MACPGMAYHVLGTFILHGYFFIRNNVNHVDSWFPVLDVNTTQCGNRIGNIRHNFKVSPHLPLIKRSPTPHPEPIPPAIQLFIGGGKAFQLFSCFRRACFSDGGGHSCRPLSAPVGPPIGPPIGLLSAPHRPLYRPPYRPPLARYFINMGGL